jgi:hypothetical protein
MKYLRIVSVPAEIRNKHPQNKRQNFTSRTAGSTNGCCAVCWYRQVLCMKISKAVETSGGTLVSTISLHDYYYNKHTVFYTCVY